MFALLVLQYSLPTDYVCLQVLNSTFPLNLHLSLLDHLSSPTQRCATTSLFLLTVKSRSFWFASSCFRNQVPDPIRQPLGIDSSVSTRFFHKSAHRHHILQSVILFFRFTLNTCSQNLAPHCWYHTHRFGFRLLNGSPPAFLQRSNFSFNDSESIDLAVCIAIVMSSILDAFEIWPRTCSVYTR